MPAPTRHALRRSGLLAATACALLAEPALAQDVTVMNGEVFDLMGSDESIGTLNIESGGTVALGSNRLDLEDNEDSVFAGTITGFEDDGQLKKNGSGTVTLSGCTMTGGEVHVNGGGARQEGGTSSIFYFAVGSDGGTGTMDLSGGVLNIQAGPASPSPALQVGDFGGVGVFNQTGGTVRIGLNEASSLNVGNQGGTGTYNLSGGALELYSGLYSLGRSTTDSRNSDGTMNVSGTGLLDIRGGNFIIGDRDAAGAASTAHGTLVQTGGTIRVDNSVGFFLSGFDNAVAVDGRYDLLGGVLEIGGNSLRDRYNNGTAGYLFNLGGGTIRVTGSQLTTLVDATLLDGTLSTIDTNGLGATWSGLLGGGGGLAKTGAGTLSLQNGANAFTGGIVVEEGTLTGSIDGALPDGNAITIDGGTLDLADFALQATALAGSGGTLDLGTATLTLDQTADTSFAGAIEGTGGLVKNGTGVLELTGISGYSGATAVNGGGLVVNGSIANSAVTVAGGAFVGGSGALGALALQSGSTVAPGNSIGTMTTGDVTFDPGSTYEVEVDALGNSDLIDSSGTVTINGGTVSVLTGLGTQVAMPYVIVDAVTVAGPGFDGVTTDSLFLDGTLTQTPTQVLLQLVRNAVAYASLGGTPNQMAVAGAADGLPMGNALADALATLASVEEAQAAFDLLSGEIHASVRSQLLEDSRFLREAVHGRLGRPGDAPGAGVTLGDCEVVSREVAAQLDVDDPIRTPYQLEVSSPGLDRPLTKPSHFTRFRGKKARVELTLPLNGQRRFVGRIAGASEQGVRLATDHGETELAFNAIARARLVPNYSIRTAEGES